MNVTNINNLNIKSELDVENKSAVLEPNKSVMEIFESRLKARLMSNRPKVSGSIGPITEGSMFKPSGSIASAFNNTENSTSAKKVFDATSHGNLPESTSGITNNNSNDRISAKMADGNIPNAGSAPVLHKSTVFGQYSASAKHNLIPTPKHFEKTNPTITLSSTDTSTSIGRSSIAGNNNIANTAINAQSKPGFEKADEKNKKQPMIKVKTLAEILEEKRKRKSESESCLTPEEPIVSASDKTDNDTLDKNIKDDSNSSHIRSMHTSSETGKVTSTNTTPPRKLTVNEFATPGRSPPKDSSSLPNETCGNFDMYFFPEPISTPKNTFISTKTNGNTTPTTFAHDSSYQQRDIFASPILVLKDKTLIALEDECDINRKKVRLSLDYYM
ncbi:hypothetical protein AX774_g3497 [Zancudomyces culisetae]|uniref:Uncharacterized protein n=1 Tax=Zancudomyces culisetae TaxID=1213189 RepID=A0A1R1PPX0_ZANCU|nr:hypothetical protein AX774_g3497 [Zancudomyces culisetae]|eukprot:OMH83007.1 hypothetical protein AX774_g3497 [Zancudomyces culisetae]